MPLDNEREKFDHVGFDFLITDLEMGLTLARIARQSDKGAEKRSRNTHNARRAYDAVRRLAERAMLTDEQRTEL